MVIIHKGKMKTTLVTEFRCRNVEDIGHFGTLHTPIMGCGRPFFLLLSFFFFPQINHNYLTIGEKYIAAKISSVLNLITTR